MGLYVQSLANIPSDADRDYFIYLLDYGWDEPLGEALKNNYERMVGLAAKNRAVVIRGTDRVHFQDEVFSWHHLNGEDAETLLPAILITNRHPEKFRESFGQEDTRIENDLKLVLIPLRPFCKNATEVVSLVQRLFRDVAEGKDLSNFSVVRSMQKGFKGALADALILQPNWNGLGVDLKVLYQHLRGNTSDRGIARL